VLIHGNYLWQKDIEICLGFDAESFADRPEIDAMRELHAALGHRKFNRTPLQPQRGQALSDGPEGPRSALKFARLAPS